MAQSARNFNVEEEDELTNEELIQVIFRVAVFWLIFATVVYVLYQEYGLTPERRAELCVQGHREFCPPGVLISFRKN